MNPTSPIRHTDKDSPPTTWDASLTPAKAKTNHAHGQYVATMFHLLSRGLVASSMVDTKIQEHIRQLPDHLVIAMTVFGTPIGFVLKVVAEGQTPKHLRLAPLSLLEECLTAREQAGSPPLLHIRFKHLSHAYAVLSFQESTATAFAYDRMVVDGDLGLAVTMVNCLNRLESVILPKVLARKAIKSYPSDLSLTQKLELSLKIYGKLAASYF